MSKMESDGCSGVDFYISDSDSGSKRKGSPLARDEPLKRQASADDITISTKQGPAKQGPAHTMKSSAEEDPSFKKPKTKSVSFPEMIKHSFKDPSFQESITPVLAELIRPLIQESIESAINVMRGTVVEEMINSNKALQNTVKNQSRIISEQKVLIEEQKILIDTKNETIDELQSTQQVVIAELDQLRLSHNDLEQYGRGNSLRINNLVFNSPTGPPKDEESLTLAVLDFLNSVVLKGIPKLGERDIDRCHYVGKPKKSGTQQILVKFARYHDKWMVYSAKKNLKNHPNKTFLTEDLTATNHSIIKALLPLKKNGKIDSFWTRDGRVIVKTDKNEDPIRISASDNINLKLGVAPVAPVVNEGSFSDTDDA
ncbi:MAG: hypothetical protein N0E48_01995 [Candidatus Thiodiazotropha endolucinida]|nr:hypothetical protein [Candidatus Thiodiazotropha endolucinida]